MTDQQVANAAFAGGFRGADLVTAVAVALAEHRGHVDFSAVSKPNHDGSIDYGIWQINSVHGYAVADLLSVVGNARAAFQVYSSAGNKFTPWSTFNDGLYLVYLPRAKAVAGSASDTGIVTDPKIVTEFNVTIALQQFLQVIGRAGAWITNGRNIVRIAYVAVGGSMVLAGLTLAAKPQIEQVAKAIK